MSQIPNQTIVGPVLPPRSHVLVLGLGLQGGGVGDVNYLHDKGYELKISDQKTATELESSVKKISSKIPLYLGEKVSPELISWADYILVNPGVPLDSEGPQMAIKLSKKLVNRTTLFAQNCPVPIVAVTGTRGKSTTTELIFQVLAKEYPGRILRGGNTPNISDLALLSKIKDDTKFVVLELSSFQLEFFHLEKVSPTYSVVTNLYPDHLNRYPDMTEYARAKSAICLYQTSKEITFYNQDNPACLEITKDCKGELIAFKTTDLQDFPNPPHLPGMHNRQNMAAVMALATHLGIAKDSIFQVFNSFQGLPYRQEDRGQVSGVSYINDTTATTPTATIKALETITTSTILIMGGAEKGLPTRELFNKLANTPHLKGLVILGGKNNPSLQQALTDPSLSTLVLGQVDSMLEAVNLAHSQAIAGDTVLLSPAFASFDLFQNEFDRGEKFNQAVIELKDRSL